MAGKKTELKDLLPEGIVLKEKGGQPDYESLCFDIAEKLKKANEQNSLLTGQMQQLSAAYNMQNQEYVELLNDTSNLLASIGNGISPLQRDVTKRINRMNQAAKAAQERRQGQQK